MLSDRQLLHTSPQPCCSPNHTDLLDLIKHRRSVREYSKIKPDLAEIDRIISCAACAPSAHNAQPWRFFIIDDAKKKKALIEGMAARFQQDMERDSVPETVMKGKVRQSVRLFSGAPVVIIACVDMVVMDSYPDQARQLAEMVMAAQSLAAAIQNLLLAAKAVGLGGCWYCAPLFCPEVVKAALSLTDSHIPQALITLGYPKKNPPMPSRLELDEVRCVL